MTQPTILVSLVGHQPLPTLLAMRHLKPHKVVLLTSNDERIKTICDNLSELAGEIILAADAEQTKRKIEVLPSTAVDPWNMLSVGKRLKQVLRKERNFQLICDVTGGTKAMAIGLTQMAREQNAEIVYTDSDTLNTRMWRYKFTDGGLQLEDGSPEPIPALVNIQDLFHTYLNRRVLKYKPNTDKDKGSWFERDVRKGFLSLVDCLEQSVVVAGKEEADLVLRIQNRFALVECKALKNFNMKGIQQLNNMASERYLGTYTGKILAVTLEDQGTLTCDVKEIAKQHNISILHLEEWQGDAEREHTWSPQAVKQFQQTLEEVFGKL